MSYEVIKTINGQQYRYLQRTYREGGKVKTESTYLGPVRPKRRIIGALLEALREQVKTKQPWHLTPEQIERYYQELAERMEQRDHINGILTGPTITMEQLQEVIEHQTPGHREDTPEEAARALEEVQAVPEFAPEHDESAQPTLPEPLLDEVDSPLQQPADVSPTLSEQPPEASPSEEPSEPGSPSEMSGDAAEPSGSSDM